MCKEKKNIEKKTVQADKEARLNKHQSNANKGEINNKLERKIRKNREENRKEKLEIIRDNNKKIMHKTEDNTKEDSKERKRYKSHGRKYENISSDSSYCSSEEWNLEFIHSSEGSTEESPIEYWIEKDFDYSS